MKESEFKEISVSEDVKKNFAKWRNGFMRYVCSLTGGTHDFH